HLPHLLSFPTRRSSDLEIVISYSPGPRRFSTYLPSLSEARERWTPLSTFLISIVAPAIGAPLLFDTEPWNDPVVSFWAGAWPASPRHVTKQNASRTVGLRKRDIKLRLSYSKSICNRIPSPPERSGERSNLSES